MTAPITVLYASTFGASDAVAGLAWSSIGVSLLLVDLFGTQVIPRLNARTLLWVALSVFASGLVISGLAPNLGVMIAGRVLQGGAAAFCLGGALQVVVRFSPPDEAGKAIGTFNAAWFAGVAMGPLLGGGLADIGGGQFGYRLAFIVNAGICLTAAVVARVSLPPIPAIGRPRVGLPRRVFARPGLRLWPVLALGMLGDGLRGGLVFTAIPLFGEDRLGLQPGAIGLALSAFAVVDIASMRYGGMLADRIGPRRVLGGAWSRRDHVRLRTVDHEHGRLRPLVRRARCAARGVVGRSCRDGRRRERVIRARRRQLPDRRRRGRDHWLDRGRRADGRRGPHRCARCVRRRIGARCHVGQPPP